MTAVARTASVFSASSVFKIGPYDQPSRPLRPSREATPLRSILGKFSDTRRAPKSRHRDQESNRVIFLLQRTSPRPPELSPAR